MYLFLDIDGVLTSLRGHRGTMSPGGESNDIDPLSAAIVNQIAQITGAALVIVSSRRHTNSRDSMERFLRKGGVTAPLAEDWAVRDAYDDEGHVRGAAVEEYCSEHRIGRDQYLILDDMDHGYSFEQYGRLVQPDTVKGLMMEDFELAGRILQLPHTAMVEARRALAPLAAAAGVGKAR